MVSNGSGDTSSQNPSGNTTTGNSSGTIVQLSPSLTACQPAPDNDPVYNYCFDNTVGNEGGYSDEPNDPGNWTMGRIGVGSNNGTKYGISAASYPHLDIRNLTLVDAKAIYYSDFYIYYHCDILSPQLAVLMFDAVVNHGANGVIFLQTTCGVLADGIIGVKTRLAYVQMRTSKSDEWVCQEYMARRWEFITKLDIFAEDRLGFCRRLSRLPYQSMALQLPSS